MLLFPSMRSTTTSTMLHGHILIDASSKLKLNLNVPGLCCLSWHGGGIKPGLLNLSITYFQTKKLATNFLCKELGPKELLRRAQAAQSKYQKWISSKLSLLRSNNVPILPMKHHAYVFVKTEAEACAHAVDLIKLTVALHSSVVK